MRHGVGCSSSTADTPVMPAASSDIVEVASPGASLLPYFRGCPVPRWQAVPLLPPELNRQALIPGNKDGQILYTAFVEMSTQVLLCNVKDFPVMKPLQNVASLACLSCMGACHPLPANFLAAARAAWSVCMQQMMQSARAWLLKGIVWR